MIRVWEEALVSTVWTASLANVHLGNLECFVKVWKSLQTRHIDRFCIVMMLLQNYKIWCTTNFCKFCRQRQFLKICVTTFGKFRRQHQFRRICFFICKLIDSRPKLIFMKVSIYEPGRMWVAKISRSLMKMCRFTVRYRSNLSSCMPMCLLVLLTVHVNRTSSTLLSVPFLLNCSLPSL